jgi:hypothetical protein
VGVPSEDTERSGVPQRPLRWPAGREACGGRNDQGPEGGRGTAALSRESSTSEMAVGLGQRSGLDRGPTRQRPGGAGRLGVRGPRRPNAADGGTRAEPWPSSVADLEPGALSGRRPGDQPGALSGGVDEARSDAAAALPALFTPDLVDRQRCRARNQTVVLAPASRHGSFRCSPMAMAPESSTVRRRAPLPRATPTDGEL